MAEHLDAHQLSAGATHVLLYYLAIYFGHLIHVQLASQHGYIGKLCVKLQRLDVADIQLGTEVHLYPTLAAIYHYGHVRGYHGGDVSLGSSINNLMHGVDVFTIDNGVDGEVRLHAMLLTGGGNLFQIVYGEGVGRVRPHIELADTEINRVGTRLYGSSQAFTRAHRCHYFKFRNCCFHAAKVVKKC